jgi:hypothetical protein
MVVTFSLPVCPYQLKNLLCDYLAGRLEGILVFMYRVC